MSQLNRVWHEANRMPKKPTEAQRAMWHIEHNKNCQCRKPSPKEQALIDTYSRAAPSATNKA